MDKEETAKSKRKIKKRYKPDSAFASGHRKYSQKKLGNFCFWEWFKTSGFILENSINEYPEE